MESNWLHEHFVLQATNLLSETGQTIPGQTYNAGMLSNPSTDFVSSSSAPTASFIAKTVDYGHGRGQYMFCIY